MRNRSRFSPAMLRLLERKRAEKRALDRAHHFTRDPERWLTSALGPNARHLEDQPEPGGRFIRFSPPPELPPRPIIFPVRASQLTLPDTVATRAAGHYAILQAEEEVAARKKAKKRRKKATAIDTKRLKVAVERVRKPSITKPSVSAGARTHSEPTDHWLGRTRHPGLELGPDGGE